MRIITDGKRYAVARYRWIFTQTLDENLKSWWCFDGSCSKYCWFDTLEEAKEKMSKYKELKEKPKYWDVK